MLSSVQQDPLGRDYTYKTPVAVLDYKWNWVDWLIMSGNDVISSFAIDTTGGITASNVTQSSPGQIVAFIAGGTPGVPATATCRITTTGGRTDTRRLLVNVVDR